MIKLRRQLVGCQDGLHRGVSQVALPGDRNPSHPDVPLIPMSGHGQIQEISDSSRRSLRSRRLLRLEPGRDAWCCAVKITRKEEETCCLIILFNNSGARACSCGTPVLKQTNLQAVRSWKSSGKPMEPLTSYTSRTGPCRRIP